jgi:hypothetical protein
VPVPLELELPPVAGAGLTVPGVPVVPPLPGVPLELPPMPVLPELLPVPLVLLPELAPAPLRWSRRQSSFCRPVSESQRVLAEPVAPALLPPLIPLPLLVLPEVCAMDTVAAPISAAVTVAHSIFIIILGS